MKLDDPTTTLYYLREMSHAGTQAHGAAGEDDGRTGAVRDLLFGLNSIVDALVALIDEATS